MAVGDPDVPAAEFPGVAAGVSFPCRLVGGD